MLACCAVSLSYMGFSPILATIAEAFPDVDLSLAQMIMTIPNLMFIVFSPLAGVLMLHSRKKKPVLISVCLCIIGGLFFITAGGILSQFGWYHRYLGIYHVDLYQGNNTTITVARQKHGIYGEVYIARVSK